MSLTAKSNKLMELPGNISETVVSSTYLVLRCQFLSRSLIIMAKSVVPSLVPCGTPPWVLVQGDRKLPTLTTWVRFVRKAFIQIYTVVSISKELRCWRRMLWSIMSKPFGKSAKNIRALQFPESTASYIACSK